MQHRPALLDKTKMLDNVRLDSFGRSFRVLVQLIKLRTVGASVDRDDNRMLRCEGITTA